MPSSDDRQRGVWRPRLTLRIRLALLMVLVVAGLGGVNHVYLETRLLDELENELELRAIDLARYLSGDSTDLVLQQDFVTLQSLLSEARRNSQDVVYAFVMDTTGQILAHTFESDFPASLKFLNRYRGRDDYRVRRIDVLGESFRDVAVPLYGGSVGVLHLGVRDGRILRQVAGTSRELTFVLVVAVVVGATAAYGSTYFSLKPLGRVLGALERFQPGKHCETIPVRRNDEVSDLARRVNEVTARLDESHRQMRQTEKLVAAGVIASGIAHEINNPISGLQNCLRRIRADPHDTRQTEEYCALMLEATQHIERVVRGLLDFSCTTPREKLIVDMGEVVRKALALTRFRSARNRVEIVEQIPRTAVWVLGAEEQLVQVAVNVTLNAIDAMPDGGTLSVALETADYWARLRVRDTGIGIQPEVLERVFEPFFTTKKAGKGTGLGLAVTHGIVAEHGGRIGIVSEPGKGTEVQISLALEHNHDRGTA